MKAVAATFLSAAALAGAPSYEIVDILTASTVADTRAKD